jgi:hypothetical protein
MDYIQDEFGPVQPLPVLDQDTKRRNDNNNRLSGARPMDNMLGRELLHAVRENNRLVKLDTEQKEEVAHLLKELIHIDKDILHLLKNHWQSYVIGGFITQISGDTMSGATLVPIQPGQTPVFQVTPTFSGPAFATLQANAAVSSSDPANFPVQLVSTDPTGLTFSAPIPDSAAPVGGAEDITVTWTYTNTDGKVVTVTGTVTEEGIVDDVTGGTFAQIV